MTIDQPSLPTGSSRRGGDGRRHSRSNSQRQDTASQRGPQTGQRSAQAGKRGAWAGGQGGSRPTRRRGRSGPAREARPVIAPERRAAIEEFDPSKSAFSGMGVADTVVKILGADGIVEPTAVQAAVIPDALAGRDVLGRARTGSGKTLAFGLPILTQLAGGKSRANRPRALVVVPTRELAGQVASSLDPLAAALRLRLVTVYGGAPYDRQIRRLDRGADVVVATPGRLADLVRRGACQLDDVEIVTLDEADHLCDLGFFPVIDSLVAATPDGGQRLLLSATLDGDVDRLVRRHLSAPVRHEIDPDAGSMTTMDHHVLVVGQRDKIDMTTALLRANPRSIVFTRTKRGATRLASSLDDAGVSAVDLHGDLSQRARERNLDRFKNGTAQVVVATDVAARGIHVDGVGLVVHFDPAGESKSYLHRSGRTARAGASGAVVTVATAGEARQLGSLFRQAGVDVKRVDASLVDGPMTTQTLADAPGMADSGPSQDEPRRGRNGAGGRNNGRGRNDGRGRSRGAGPRRQGRRPRT